MKDHYEYPELYELAWKLEQENKTQAAIIAAKDAEIMRLCKATGAVVQISKDTHTCDQYGDNCQAHNLHCGWPNCAVARTTPLDNKSEEDLRELRASLQPNDDLTPLDDDTEEDIASRIRYWLHKNHCNVGEYEGSCKYGDDDCPELVGH